MTSEAAKREVPIDLLRGGAAECLGLVLRGAARKAWPTLLASMCAFPAALAAAASNTTHSRVPLVESSGARLP